MKVILDGLTISTKEDFYLAVRQQLDLPDYFGDNLDALNDFIEERGELPVITIYHYTGLRHALGLDYLNRLFTMLTDCQCEIHILS